MEDYADFGVTIGRHLAFLRSISSVEQLCAQVILQLQLYLICLLKADRACPLLSKV